MVDEGDAVTTTILEPLTDPISVICVRRVWSGMHLVAEIGRRYDHRSWVVQADPEAFIRCVPLEMDRSEAMVCIQAIDGPKPGGEPWELIRLAWEHQWFPRGHDLVQKFGAKFRPARMTD